MFKKKETKIIANHLNLHCLKLETEKEKKNSNSKVLLLCDQSL